jgi:hypothetical protein
MSISKLQASVTTALKHAKGYADAIADRNQGEQGHAKG